VLASAFLLYSLEKAGPSASISKRLSVMPDTHLPPLKPLHSDQSLSPAKLQEMERQTTDILEVSLRPGQPHCLKVRPDGTVLDGHHRIFILRKRGISVNDLPREIIEKG
jgi:hypothetical protein